jgi:hypothetical protein
MPRYKCVVCGYSGRRLFPHEGEVYCIKHWKEVKEKSKQIQLILDGYVQGGEVLYEHDNHIGETRADKEYIASFSTYGERTVHLYANLDTLDVEEFID